MLCIQSKKKVIFKLLSFAHEVKTSSGERRVFLRKIGLMDRKLELKNSKLNQDFDTHF